jgi:hypothetical protein
MTCSSEIMDIWSFISVPHICLHARNGAEVYSSVFLFFIHMGGAISYNRVFVMH